MRIEYNTKPLNYWLQRKSPEQGFTLIELLVVIIIIGILSVIALPAFLNQASKAKQSEAKQNIGAMNRAQQGYYTENIVFGTSLENLGLGIQSQTVHYQYSVQSVDGTTFTQTVNNRAVTSHQFLRSYIGGVTLGLLEDGSPGVTQAVNHSVMCETRKKGKNLTASDMPDVENQSISLGKCEDSTVSVYRVIK